MFPRDGGGSLGAREPREPRVRAPASLVFALAKGLKYWAIATLGDRWTFRVLVPPRSTRVAAGPYRFLRHPNYVGVAGELAGMALMAQAPIAGSLRSPGLAR